MEAVLEKAVDDNTSKRTGADQAEAVEKSLVEERRLREHQRRLRQIAERVANGLVHDEYMESRIVLEYFAALDRPAFYYVLGQHFGTDEADNNALVEGLARIRFDHGMVFGNGVKLEVPICP
jgi:hypothetical protein